MERLTEIIDNWVHLVDPAGVMDITELREYCNNECNSKCVPDEIIKPYGNDEPRCMHCDCIVNWFYQSFVRLSEYEETGLTSKEVAQLLKEKQERENPQPLSIKNLYDFEWGNPIFILFFKDDYKGSNWFIVESVTDEFIDFEFGDELDLCQYGTEWIAYAHRPKPESEVK